jgi:hypothetical protein
VITINVQVVPSDVAQRVIVKFVTNENVTPADILLRLRAQFGDETFLRTQVYDWSKSFNEGRTEVGNMRSLQLSTGQASEEMVNSESHLNFLPTNGMRAHYY